MDADTIAAVATPIGSGGIGIIKISGKNSLGIAESVFRRAPGSRDDPRGAAILSSPSLQSHHLYYGHIVDPENGRVLDEVLLSVMLAPNTYTTEDIVEINTHAGHVVLASILELVLKSGARLAEPGEFTKRAYLNGRIDLTQAEAVIDIINSKTDKSLQIATAQIKGGLKEKVESIRNDLLDLLAETEAAIDFPDEVEDIVDIDAVSRVAAELAGVLQQYEDARLFRDGLKMAVVGKPNVGKSSLMNRLLRSDRAIVTAIPGTTRDLIEETLNIRGIPVVLADTAGLHETDDPVEVIGIQKTQEYINGTDLVLFVVDGSAPLAGEDHKIFETIRHKQIIVVVNKDDLVGAGRQLQIPEAWTNAPRIDISALFGQGLEELKEVIARLAVGDYRLEAETMIIPNLRHKVALERAHGLVGSAVEEIRKKMPFELVSIDIQEAVDALGEIIGVFVREDVIEKIFSRFCIGK